MSKASDYGKTFLAGVLAKITDPDQRTQVEAALSSNEDALVVIGAGALAQADINRRYQDIDEKAAQIKADYDKLNTWYDEKKAALEDYDRLRANPNPNPNPNPAPTDSKKFVDVDTFNKEMRDQQISAANYLGLQNVLTLKHFKDFNEVLDTRELLIDPNLGKTLPDGRTYGLIDAYQTKYQDKLTERDKTAESARIKTLVDAEVAERVKGLSAQQPFPIKGTGSSPLDSFDPAAKPPDVPLVDRAAAEYNRLQDARG